MSPPVSRSPRVAFKALRAEAQDSDRSKRSDSLFVIAPHAPDGLNMDGRDRRGVMQRVLIRATVIAGVVAAFSTNPGATPRREEHSRAAAIDALDRCVQERFVRIDKGFGISRISQAMHNTRQFVPTNDVENR